MKWSGFPWPKDLKPLRKALNLIMVLIVLVMLYRALCPSWLHLSISLSIATILTLILWLYDEPPSKRVFTGFSWLGLFGVWYYYRPPWLSLTSAILLALLIGILFYSSRRPTITKPPEYTPGYMPGYKVEPWDTERQKLVVEAWKQTVAVQMHFNDLELRIRNYALSLLLAAGGAASISLKEEIYFHVPGEGVQRHISVLLLSFGLVGWLGFYLMDRFWYHRLLYGAVRHGQFIEEEFGDELSFLRLTKAIGDESSIWFLGVRIRSPRKIDVFYGLFALFLLAAIYVIYTTKTKGL